MAFSPRVLGYLVKKGLHKGGGHGHPRTPLATPLEAPFCCQQRTHRDCSKTRVRESLNQRFVVAQDQNNLEESVHFTFVNLMRSRNKNTPKNPVAPVSRTRPLIQRRVFLKFPERQNALNIMSMLIKSNHKY